MILTNSPKDLIAMAKTLAWLREIFNIFDPDLDSDTRWNNLQKWLETNPDKRKFIETISTLPGDEAFVYLLDSVGISEETLRTYDPFGFTISRAKTTIEKLQRIYLERKEFSEDGRRINSPGAKRKRSAAKKENK
jgi:hypothetical protein